MNKEDLVYVAISVEIKPENNTDAVGITLPTVGEDGLIEYSTFYNDGFISHDPKHKPIHYLKPIPLSELIAERNKVLMDALELCKIRFMNAEITSSRRDEFVNDIEQALKQFSQQ